MLRLHVIRREGGQERERAREGWREREGVSEGERMRESEGEGEREGGEIKIER